MFYYLRHALILPALLLLPIAPHACADDAPTTTTEKTVTSLTYGPDGQSLWSVDRAGQLTIRASDGVTELYSGAIPLDDYGFGELKVLQDGSFVVGTNGGVMRWFEPPQKEQPIELRREFKGMELQDWERDLVGVIQGPLPDWLHRWRDGIRSFGDMAVSPDGTRVIYSYLTSFRPGSAPSQAVVRVWYLQKGSGIAPQFLVRSEQTIKLPDSDDNVWGTGDLKALPFSGSTMYRFNPHLAWLDNEAFVIGQGLWAQAYSAQAEKLLGGWRPTNAPEDLVRADLKRQKKYLTMSPVEVNEFVKFARRREFEVAAQRLLALSPDGNRLLVWDDKQLLTLWDIKTGEAQVQILSDSAEFVPWGAEFSPDGETVAAWDGKTFHAWRGQSDLMVNLIQPFDAVALLGDQVALVRAGDEIRFLSFKMLRPRSHVGPRPARLQDLREVRPGP